jgi:cytochrome c
VKALLLLGVVALVPLNTALADDLPVGDPVAGKTIFQKCAGCHSVGPGAINKTGPILNGIVGEKAGLVPGYDFSAAMKNSGVTWDAKTLAQYLRAPRAMIPGIKMTFVGLQRDADLANVIAYLKTFKADGSPAP